MSNRSPRRRGLAAHLILAACATVLVHRPGPSSRQAGPLPPRPTSPDRAAAPVRPPLGEVLRPIEPLLGESTGAALRTLGPDEALNHALEQLRSTQHADGYWGSGAGDVGETGLALLAFLGAGNTHKAGEFRETVKKGLKYLHLVQDPEGCFADRADPDLVRKHAIAAFAVCEAYSLSQSPVLKRYAQKGVDFVLAGREDGGADENDTITSGWMILALASARDVSLAVDEEAFRTLQHGASRLREVAPKLAADGGAADFEALYIGALAIRQFGGEAWTEWRRCGGSGARALATAAGCGRSSRPPPGGAAA